MAMLLLLSIVCTCNAISTFRLFFNSECFNTEPIFVGVVSTCPSFNCVQEFGVRKACTGFDIPPRTQTTASYNGSYVALYTYTDQACTLPVTEEQQPFAYVQKDACIPTAATTSFRLAFFNQTVISREEFNSQSCLGVPTQVTQHTLNQCSQSSNQYIYPVAVRYSDDANSFGLSLLLVLFVAILLC